MQAAYLNQLNDGFNNAGLKVLGVNINSPKILNQVRPWINKRKIGYDISVDPSGKLSDEFDVKGLPTLFMVDKNGIVIHKTAGFVDGDESKYLDMVTQYLDSENIKYEEFNFEKESKVKKDAILQIDF